MTNRRRTMCSVLKLHILRPLQPRLVLFTSWSLLLSPFCDRFPQSPHVLLGHYFIFRPAQHEDGSGGWD